MVVPVVDFRIFPVLATGDSSRWCGGLSDKPSLAFGSFFAFWSDRIFQAHLIYRPTSDLESPNYPRKPVYFYASVEVLISRTFCKKFFFLMMKSSHCQFKLRVPTWLKISIPNEINIILIYRNMIELKPKVSCTFYCKHKNNSRNQTRERSEAVLNGSGGGGGRC